MGWNSSPCAATIDSKFSKDNKVHALTNPWMPPQPAQAMGFWAGQESFRTWDEYRDKLYHSCEEWKPDIVVCAVAVSNYTPTWVMPSICVC